MISETGILSLSPYGYMTNLLGTSLCNDLTTYHIKLDRYDQDPISFMVDIPRMYNGVIIIGGTRRMVLQCTTDHGPIPRISVARSIIQNAFNKIVASVIHKKNPITDEIAQIFVNNAISTSEICVPIPYTELGEEGFRQMIKLYREGPGLSTNWRSFTNDLWGVLDPNSTPQSEKINLVFRASVDKNTSLCEVLDRNCIAVSHNPRRVFLCRTAFEAHLPVILKKTPLVSNPNTNISGLSLKTAVMEWGVKTFEDAIVFSSSAALRITATRDVVETIVTTKKPLMKVKLGAWVKPGGVIAYTADTKEPVHAQKIQVPSQLVSVDSFQTVQFGCTAWRTRFKYTAAVPLKDGDKVTGRHGNKGVVHIVPDEEMPFEKTPSGFSPIDVIVSPISVVKRIAGSFFLEMMLGSKAVAENTNIEVPAFGINEKLSFKQLVKEGYGDATQLYLCNSSGAKPLPFSTFVGFHLWLRNEKLAHEQGSVQKGPTVINHRGLPTNSANRNGCRRDMGKSLAFGHRNLKKILAWTVSNNVVGIDVVQKLIGAVEPSFRFSSWGAGKKISIEKVSVLPQTIVLT